MQLPAQINEAAASPASPSSPGSDPGSRTPTAREKPVKVLPCPRCESMNTKFCYYNNYSVTQPRHFCRQCQRYWTAGGTLRNVPVGGGSRKKNRHHPRPGDPYSQRSPGASSNPFGLPGGQGGANVGFQQQQEMVAALNLPGFSMQDHQGHQGHQYVVPYGLEQLSQLSPGVYASILNRPPPQENEAAPSLQAMFGSTSTGASSINPGGYFTPAAPAFHTDHNVKPEFWPASSMAAPQGNYQVSRFESSSSMLLNLGLNSDRPTAPVWDQSGDVKPAASTTGKNGSSPLHGSSIEEEGSTPSNGFSKSGYEEGDAVSSMWHSLHDMDNLHLSVKW